MQQFKKQQLYNQYSCNPFQYNQQSLLGGVLSAFQANGNVA